MQKLKKENEDSMAKQGSRVLDEPNEKSEKPEQEAQANEEKKEQETPGGDEGYGWYNPVGWFASAPEEDPKAKAKAEAEKAELK